MTKIEFYLGAKTLLVQSGRGELYIKGFIASTGVITPLTTREKRLLKDALEHNGNVKLGEHTDLFLSSLTPFPRAERHVGFIWHMMRASAVGNDRLVAQGFAVKTGLRAGYDCSRCEGLQAFNQ
jgi:hypothetical protein